MALQKFAPKALLRETFLTHLAVAPDGSSVVYGRRTIEDGAYKTRLWRVPTSGGRAEQTRKRAPGFGSSAPHSIEQRFELLQAIFVGHESPRPTP